MIRKPEEKYWYLLAWNDNHRKLWIKIKLKMKEVFTCLKWQPSKTGSQNCYILFQVFTYLKWQPPKTKKGCHIPLARSIYLLEMIAIENNQIILYIYSIGIYLFEMTTTENWDCFGFGTNCGIYLLEMTTIENLKHYNKCF